jgi:Na+/H+-dicarboxylate symporter
MIKILAKIKPSQIPLLPAVIAAIALGIICGQLFPAELARLFTTFNGIFSNFLGFIIPLLILGLIAPGIADLGKSAGKMLFITVVLAYGFTLFSGFFTYGVAALSFKNILAGAGNFAAAEEAVNLKPFFTIEMPPLMGVMTALILGFTLGLGIAASGAKNLKVAAAEFKGIIYLVIHKVIIPFLPLYIFGIFLEITMAGQVFSVLGVFVKLILIIFAITAVMLVTQFSIAGAYAGRNPFKLLKKMLPAYATALGTQSSAATIPVTLEQTVKNGICEDVAGFVIPLCATIHLSGSTMKIVACSLAIMFITGMPVDFAQYAGFIFMLGVTMVAAPGVPGGAIMASVGILQSFLGFDEKAVGLMIALYIAMDSFGTACNVTGDGAIAVIVNKIYGGNKRTKI